MGIVIRERPELAQVRQRQVFGQPSSAEPDRCDPIFGPEGNGVADDRFLPSGLKTGSDNDSAPPQAPDELGFIFGGDRGRPYEAGQGDPWGFEPTALGRCARARLGSTRASLSPRALQPPLSRSRPRARRRPARAPAWTAKCPPGCHRLGPRTLRCGCAGCLLRLCRARRPPRLRAAFPLARTRWPQWPAVRSSPTGHRSVDDHRQGVTSERCQTWPPAGLAR